MKTSQSIRTMDKMRNGQKILVQNPNVKRSLWRWWHRQVENTKTDHKYRSHEGVDSMPYSPMTESCEHSNEPSVPQKWQLSNYQTVFHLCWKKVSWLQFKIMVYSNTLDWHTKTSNWHFIQLRLAFLQHYNVFWAMTLHSPVSSCKYFR